MEFLAKLFVGKPLNIALVAVMFMASYIVLRSGAAGALRNPRALWIAVVGWLVYALWEWLVMWRTPEANIRVDLLLIWPLLAILSGVAIYLAFRRPRGET